MPVSRHHCPVGHRRAPPAYLRRFQPRKPSAVCYRVSGGNYHPRAQPGLTGRGSDSGELRCQFAQRGTNHCPEWLGSIGPMRCRGGLGWGRVTGSSSNKQRRVIMSRITLAAYRGFVWLQYLSTRMSQSSTTLHVLSRFFTYKLEGTSSPSRVLVFHAAILSARPPGAINAEAARCRRLAWGRKR